MVWSLSAHAFNTFYSVIHTRRYEKSKNRRVNAIADSSFDCNKNCMSVNRKLSLVTSWRYDLFSSLLSRDVNQFNSSTNTRLWIPCHSNNSQLHICHISNNRYRHYLRRKCHHVHSPSLSQTSHRLPTAKL